MIAGDFLDHCVAAQTGNPILERVRGKSAEVTLAVYRLVKTAQVHAQGNAAVREAAAACARGLEVFAVETGSAASLTFVEDSVFVCGQLMKATRAAYEAAAELGEILRAVGVSELAFDRGATADQMLAFAQSIVTATRDPRARAAVVDAKLPGVLARKVDPRLSRKRADEGATPAQRALRVYSTALVVMRQFYEDVAAGVTVMPHQVKRLAQRLVSLADDEHPTMLGMTTMAKSHRDDAGRAVQTAILSLAIARQITSERLLLSPIVLAALMSEAGGARARRRAGERWLTDAEEAQVLGASAFACIATGGVNPQNALRTVVVLEVAWEEREPQLGRAWTAKAKPLLASEIIALARDVLERLAPRDGTEAQIPLRAVEAAIARPGVDPVLAKLLVRALGVVPIGSIVKLTSGAIGVVTGPSPSSPAALRVRVLVDASGMEPANPLTLDLGADSSVLVESVLDPRTVAVDGTRAFVDG
jgi:hypothetical protein